MKSVNLAVCVLVSFVAAAIGSLALAEAEGAGDKVMMQIDKLVAEAKVDTSKDGWKLNIPKPTATTFEDGKSYYANMQTTKGPIRIKFMPGHAPMHVTSFMYLSKMGFYDDLAFHRVITGFMAQGGCPLGSGSGGPGYKYGGEFDDSVKHDKPGLLSMANAGSGTDGSQFFLTFVKTPHLDGKHTVFGEIVDGMDSLRALEKAGSRNGRPTEVLKIEKVTIEVE